MLRFSTCLIVGLAVVAGGCGSSKKASAPATASATGTTSAGAGTTATGASGARTATHGTTPTPAPKTTAPKANAENPQNIAKANPSLEQQASQKAAESVKAGGNGSGEVLPPHSKRYPRFFELKFITSCEAAKGSNSSCECILNKQQKLKGEKGQSMAELLALELELHVHHASLQAAAHDGVPAPERVKRSVEECAK
jgi:hypothetical protein